MRKSLQKLSVMALTGMLCMSTAPCAFAAGRAGGMKAELASYQEAIADQRSELSELITDSKELTQQVKAAQRTLKEAGLITKENRGQIQDFSRQIKAKRLELKEIRNVSQGYHAEVKDARQARDIDLAKDALSALYDSKEKQIDLRMELVQLLDQKLSLLYGIQNGTQDVEESTGADSTVTVGETTAETTSSADAAADEAALEAAFDDGEELEEE